MDQPIIFTISDILWLAGAIVSISAAVKVIANVVEKFKQPTLSQGNRISELEKKSGIEYKRLTELEEGMVITQRALLALLAHGIDGNDVDAMRSAKEELTNYLIER